MPRLRTLLLGVFPLLASASFGSTPPAPAPPLGPSLAWSWPVDEDRAYVIELALALPEPLWLEGPDDLGAHLRDLDLSVFTRCSAIEENPAGWRVLCLISDVALVGEAVEDETGRLAPVLARAEAELQQGALDVGFRRDGKITSLALAGLETRDRELTLMHGTLQMLLERAFLGLELVTPAGWSGGWSQQGPGILTYLPRSQSLGAARLLMRATDVADRRQLQFDHEGRGVVQASTLAAKQGRNMGSSLSMALASSGSLVFDAEGGALVERRWAVLGQPTMSTGMSGTYVQSGLLRRVQPGDPAPELGPSGERDPNAPQTDAWLAWEAARPALEEALGGERVVFEP